LYWECRAGAKVIFPESGRGLGHVIATIFGSTVGYPSDSLASCFRSCAARIIDWSRCGSNYEGGEVAGQAMCL